MTSKDQHQHLHKEEMKPRVKARMKADATDISKIRQQLQEPIDPLDSSTHSDVNIVQIVSGRIVHEAVSIGTEMIKHCEST